jgi:hypothetical protein
MVARTAATWYSFNFARFQKIPEFFTVVKVSACWKLNIESKVSTVTTDLQSRHYNLQLRRL